MDTKTHSADPLAQDPEYLAALMPHVKAMSIDERAQWVEDGGDISTEERIYRLLVLSPIILQERQAAKMRRVARFKSEKKISWPDNGYDFIQQGGMEAIEKWQGQTAAKKAIRSAQERMLSDLETFFKEDRMLPDDVEPDEALSNMTRGRIKEELRRLCRILGRQYVDVDKRRAKTRERVRRFRARKAVA